MGAESRDTEVVSGVEILGLGLGTTEPQLEPQTMKGTKFEILLPALLPLVGPGPITPTKKVPGVFRMDAGTLAWICVSLRTFETRFTLVLLELFQVTLEFATKPAPLMVMRISGWPATAALGVIELIEELTVGEAPR